jgi:hypothetical protein
MKNCYESFVEPSMAYVSGGLTPDEIDTVSFTLVGCKIR